MALAVCAHCTEAVDEIDFWGLVGGRAARVCWAESKRQKLIIKRRGEAPRAAAIATVTEQLSIAVFLGTECMPGYMRRAALDR